MVKSRLGRGLQALIPDEVPVAAGERAETIALAAVDLNPFQPRQHFDEEKLQGLAQSIGMHGVLQPIIVRAIGSRFQILAGERRYRAAAMAGLKEIPAIVREFSDSQMLELAIIENLQREDLNPLEEAQGFQQLIERSKMTQGQVAERIGRSRPYVANTLRLLQLPLPLQELVSRETISAGHGRALLSLDDEQRQMSAAQEIIDKALSVRQTEEWVKELQRPQEGVSRETPRARKRDPDVEDLEQRLTSILGTQVRLKVGSKKGKIEILYYGSDELERILEILLSQGEI